MSKAVLISIQPKWVEKIANGEKTIEVRKSRPKLEMPFKVYIYETQGEYKTGTGIFAYGIELKGTKNGKGKVIGEFVCDRIICSQAYFDERGKNHLTNVFEEDIKRTCLTEYDLWDYIAGKAVKANQMYDGYLWHISDLKIYDKPKELSEFWTVKCTNKRNGCIGCEVKPNCIKTITRPPQSWCYVEG